MAFASEALESGVHPKPDATEPARRVPGEPLRLDGRGIAFWYQATAIAAARASCRYRIGHLTEHLAGAVAVVGPFLPRRALRGVHTLVLVRPYVDAFTARTLAALRKRGVRLVADYDDLLFDGPVDALPAVAARPALRARHEARRRVYREGLRHFDAFTAATAPLAEHLAALRPDAPVAVVPNGLSHRWLSSGRLVARAYRPGDRKVLRYLPGSPSHDADFAAVAPALARFLAAHPEVALEIIGPLDFDARTFPEGAVRHRPALLAYPELPALLASSWANVAPLADTPFTRCKSALKFLEAGAFACPTVASPNPDMARHAAGGLLLAERPAEWQGALEALLDDRTRMALGERAQRWVEAHGMAELGARRALEHFRSNGSCGVTASPHTSREAARVS